ncbi:MAG TPA: bifunctional phosphopantothenoylcysteine decarboxylase/phosphopantothenate--cysteine ligase CoaBC [Acidobacteriaceae bacterium]
MSNLPFKVTIGVTGGIAAYKAAEIVRALQQHGLDVHVVMTRAAEEFVRPLTFASLTGHKVITSMWGTEAYAEEGIEHIAEAQSTGLLLVAPATAHTLARFAHGLADDFLSTLYLATTAPVIVAPAMNVNMWNHPATQANLDTLRQRGVEIVAPGSGYLACGMTGSGRLATVESIVAAVLTRIDRQNTVTSPQIARDLTSENILITAGGTREPIDPVRFLGNRSSGRMGYALAEAALARGAKVTLISAPTALPTPSGCTRIDVTTASEMHAAVLAHLPEATIVIGAAAVSDFRPTTEAPQKLKRNGPRTLSLEPTEDIIASIAARRAPGTLVIAFAAETENLLPNARAKLARKAVDAIVANDVSTPTLGFDSASNAATFITPTQETSLPEQPKSTLAHRILDEVATLRATETANIL